MSACRSCSAPVEWVVVAASNKRMPLDPKPVEDGNVIRLSGDTVRVLTADDLASRKLWPGGPGPLWRSHFSTCSDADAWRRK